MAIAALAFAGLNACQMDWSIEFTSYPGYSPSEATLAVLYKPMQLRVLGNPTPASDDAMAAAAAAGLQGSHIVQSTVFEPIGPGRSPSYHTVIAFGAIAEANICSATAASVPAGRSQQMNAAFCRGAAALSFVQSRIGNVDDPMAKALQKHLQAVGLQLFPKENPNTAR